MDGGPWRITIQDITEDEWYGEGYDTGYEHGSAGLPNMLDVLGRRVAEVITLRPPTNPHGIWDQTKC